MTYERGTKVVVQDMIGNLVDGVIDDYVFESGCYWVNMSGAFRLFTIQELDEWNLKCVCGSDSVNHPGHAFYCQKPTPAKRS